MHGSCTPKVTCNERYNSACTPTNSTAHFPNSTNTTQPLSLSCTSLPADDRSGPHSAVSVFMFMFMSLRASHSCGLTPAQPQSQDQPAHTNMRGCAQTKKQPQTERHAQRSWQLAAGSDSVQSKRQQHSAACTPPTTNSLKRQGPALYIKGTHTNSHTINSQLNSLTHMYTHTYNAPGSP